MKVKIKTSLVVAAMLATSTVFLGCSSDSSDAQEQDTQTYTLSGVAVKGYLSESEVWIDIDEDGLKTPDELTTTDENGNYSLDIPGNIIESRFVSISGGIDTSAREPFMGNLRAVFDTVSRESVVVSPLSSLVAIRVTKGDALDVAQGKISQALGFSNISDISKDPIAEASREGGNSEILKRSLQVARVTELISKNADDGSSEDLVLDSLVDSIEVGQDLDTAFNTVAQAKITDAAKIASVTTLSDAIKNIVIIQSNDTDTMKRTIDSIESASKVATLTMTANPVARISVNNMALVIQATPLTAENKIDLAKLAEALKDTDTSSETFNPVVEAQKLKDQVVVDATPPATDDNTEDATDDNTEDATDDNTEDATDDNTEDATDDNTEDATDDTGTTAPPVVTTPTTKTLNVSTAGINDAGSLANTYNFTAGNYSYTISGFGDNDVLRFPQGNTPTIRNSVAMDGKLTIQWAYNGTVIEVVLTGITTQKGGSIFGMTSFNTAFGTNSIQVQQ